MAALLELLLQLRVVLDDAVVDDGDVARTVQVRVGVDGLGRAVGRPAGVADARGEARGRVLALELQGARPTRCPTAVRARQVSPARTSAMPAES